MDDDWYFRIRGFWRIYWGVEHYSDFDKRCCVAWTCEVEPPYRIGKAVRLRLGARAYHLGVCRFSKRPPGRELSDVTIETISKDYQGVGPELWES